MSFSIERQIFKGAVRAAVRQKCHERLLHTSYVRASEQPESSSRGTLKGGSRKRSLDGIDLEGVDLVGPPDPISNIRPMIYAPSQKVNRDERKTLPTNTTNSLQQPHPYSTHEFQQAFNNNNMKRIGDKRRIGLGLFSVYRDYLDYVCDRVEESEMKLRIAKLTTDKTTQRFWKDNNNRFTNDMQAWSQQQQQQPKQLNVIEPSQKQNSNNQELIVETPSSESDFYATWLKANAKRNKAYNVLVWKQAFEQVRLGFKVNVWRTWLSVLRTLEG